jgi:tetratricopeptide (TPR) repeat protein
MTDQTDRLNLLLTLRRYADGEKAAREALAADPRWGAGYTFLALFLLNQGKLGAAERSAREGVRHAPADPWAHLVLGIVFLRQDRPKEARAAADEVLRLDPHGVGGYQLLADAWGADGRHTAARLAARDGLARHPTDPTLLSCLGWAELRLGRPDVAREIAEQSLEHYPVSPLLHHLLGCILFERAAQTEGLRARIRFHRLADRHLAEAVRLDPATDVLRENRRNNVLSCRQLVLWLLLLVAGGLSGLLTLLAFSVTQPALTSPAVRVAWISLLVSVLPFLLMFFGSRAFMLTAPVARLGIPAAPLTRWEGWEVRWVWWLTIGVLLAAPVVAWAGVLAAKF